VALKTSADGVLHPVYIYVPPASSRYRVVSAPERIY
jgi:hypothetical protein